MAEVVSVGDNDTLTKIVKAKRNVKLHEENNWIQRVLTLNPHISHADRIYPNEAILIPDMLTEAVPDLAIWQNAPAQYAPPGRLSFAHAL